MRTSALGLSLLLTRFFGGLGFQFFIVAGIDSIYHDTFSPGSVGLIGAVLFLPSLVGPLIAGSVVDRLRRPGRIFVITQAAVFFSSLLLILGYRNPLTILAVAFLFSCLRAVRTPIFYSLMGELRDRGVCPNRAARAISLSWQLPLVIGPLLYTLASGHRGVVPAVLIVFCALSFLVSIPFWFEKTRLRPRNVSSHFSITEAASIFFENTALKSPLLVEAAVTGLLSFTALLPFLLHELHRPSSDLGLIRALMNGASIVVTVLTPQRFFDRDRPVIFYSVLILLSVSVFTLSQTQSFAGLILIVASFGMVDGWSILYRDALVLRSTETHNIGRVSSIQQVLISTTDDLGEWRAGATAEFLGVRGALMAGACAASAVGVVFLRRSTTQRRLSFVESSQRHW